MSKIEEIKFTVIPAIIASVLLLLSFFDWSYGYYTFLRIAVTGVAIYYGYYIYRIVKKQNFWFWTLMVIAILFNPLIPIYLDKKIIWTIIDIIVAGFFICLIIRLKKK